MAIVPGARPIEALAFAPLPTGRRWSFVAEVAECCTCAIPCP